MQHNKTSIHEQLENRILNGLSCEWETAVELLDSDHKVKMRKPFFTLGDMKTRLGCWSSDKKEIRLSRQFVLNHSWQAVREVLRHEMAHQFNDQVFETRNEKPHGPKFKDACHYLRADFSASKGFNPLDQRTVENSGYGRDKILFRIRKLMALAESQNKFEAEAAMLKAHELMAKYNVDLIHDHENQREFSNLFLGAPTLRHRREEYHLAGLLQDFYFVKGIWISTYVLEKGKMGRVLEISGTWPNIQTAAYVYDFVNRYINLEWRRYNRNTKYTLHRKTDFAVGIIEGFRSKINSLKKQKQVPGDSSLPLPLEDDQLINYFKYKYPRTTTISRNAVRSNRKILTDGIRIGKKLVIYKGVTDKVTSSNSAVSTRRYVSLPVK